MSPPRSGVASNGLPWFREQDPDTGEWFGVCKLCDRALTIHTEADVEECLEALENSDGCDWEPTSE